jgi:hypothetical protein
MIYTAFEIPGKGSTGLNTATTHSASKGFVNIYSGETCVWEPGKYTNNFYTEMFPIYYFIIYDGIIDFVSNTISLHGFGTVWFCEKPATDVGGMWVPVDKFGLLAPYIGVASTILVAAVATAIYAKRVKRTETKNT